MTYLPSSWRQRISAGGALFVITAFSIFLIALAGLIIPFAIGVYVVAYLFLGMMMTAIVRTRWFTQQHDVLWKESIQIPFRTLLVIGVGLSLAQAISGNYIHRIHDAPDPTTINPAILVSYLLFDPIIAPIIEESLCRGVLYPIARRGFSMTTSVIVTSLIFAAFHGNLMQIIPTAVVGMTLGWIYAYSGNLRNTITIHIINNVAAIVFGAMPFLRTIPELPVIIITGSLWLAIAGKTWRVCGDMAENPVVVEKAVGTNA